MGGAIEIFLDPNQPLKTRGRRAKHILYYDLVLPHDDSLKVSYSVMDSHYDPFDNTIIPSHWTTRRTLRPISQFIQDAQNKIVSPFHYKRGSRRKENAFVRHDVVIPACFDIDFKHKAHLIVGDPLNYIIKEFYTTHPFTANLLKHRNGFIRLSRSGSGAHIFALTYCSKTKKTYNAFLLKAKEASRACRLFDPAIYHNTQLFYPSPYPFYSLSNYVEPFELQEMLKSLIFDELFNLVVKDIPYQMLEKIYQDAITYDAAFQSLIHLIRQANNSNNKYTIYLLGQNMKTFSLEDLLYYFNDLLKNYTKYLTDNEGRWLAGTNFSGPTENFEDLALKAIKKKCRNQKQKPIHHDHQKIEVFRYQGIPDKDKAKELMLLSIMLQKNPRYEEKPFKTIQKEVENYLKLHPKLGINEILNSLLPDTLIDQAIKKITNRQLYDHFVSWDSMMDFIRITPSSVRKEFYNYYRKDRHQAQSLIKNYIDLLLNTAILYHAIESNQTIDFKVQECSCGLYTIYLAWDFFEDKRSRFSIVSYLLDSTGFKLMFRTGGHLEKLGLLFGQDEISFSSPENIKDILKKARLREYTTSSNRVFYIADDPIGTLAVLFKAINKPQIANLFAELALLPPYNRSRYYHVYYYNDVLRQARRKLRKDLILKRLSAIATNIPQLQELTVTRKEIFSINSRSARAIELEEFLLQSLTIIGIAKKVGDYNYKIKKERHIRQKLLGIIALTCAHFYPNPEDKEIEQFFKDTGIRLNSYEEFRIAIESVSPYATILHLTIPETEKPVIEAIDEFFLKNPPNSTITLIPEIPEQPPD